MNIDCVLSFENEKMGLTYLFQRAALNNINMKFILSKVF